VVIRYWWLPRTRGRSRDQPTCNPGEALKGSTYSHSISCERGVPLRSLGVRRAPWLSVAKGAAGRPPRSSLVTFTTLSPAVRLRWLLKLAWGEPGALEGVRRDP
jgi:hypothetical protein